MFELKTLQAARLWMLPPAAMEVALELLTEDRLAHPHWPHVFLVPRLMTHLWRRDLGKEADIYLPRVQWQDATRLTWQTQDRKQHRLELHRFDRDSGKARFLLKSRDWVDPAKSASIRPFSFTFTIALLASLLVSLTIVPVLAYWFMKPPKSVTAQAAAEKTEQTGAKGKDVAESNVDSTSSAAYAANAPSTRVKRVSKKNELSARELEEERERRSWLQRGYFRRFGLLVGGHFKYGCGWILRACIHCHLADLWRHSRCPSGCLQ